MFVLDPDTNEFQRIPASVEYCQSFDIDEDGFIWLTSWNTIIGFNLRTSKGGICNRLRTIRLSFCHLESKKYSKRCVRGYIGSRGLLL